MAVWRSFGVLVQQLEFSNLQAQHGIAHDRFNQQLEQSGHRVTGFSKFANALLFDGVEKGLRKLTPGKSHLGLALTAAAEHFTASWANRLFTAIDHMHLDGQVKSLILWHGLEEIEHKNVAYDLMQEIGTTYTMRVASMLFTAVFIGIVMAAGAAYFPFVDEKFDLRRYLDEIYVDLTNKGGENGFSFTHLTARAVISYLRPTFHPDDIDDLAMALEKFDRQFAAA